MTTRLLTRAGQDLRPLVFGLAEWGARYAFGDPRPEELDPEVLMWWLHGRIDTSELSKRAVIQVGFVKPVGGPTADEEIPYVGIGVAVTESVESKDVRRAARIAAKKHKALLKLQDEAQGRTAP